MEVGAYCPDHFSSLPTIKDADGTLTKSGGIGLIERVFRPLFLRYGVEKQFGLAVLHRHFDLGASERIVDCRGTATPWILGMMSEHNIQHPKIWGISDDDQLRPLEFLTSMSTPVVLDGNFSAFVDELRAALAKHGLRRTLGLRRHPGESFRGTYEISAAAGRCSIELLPEECPNSVQTIDTAFFFDEHIWKRGCRCTCNANDKDHGHGTHIYTT